MRPRRILERSYRFEDMGVPVLVISFRCERAFYNPITGITDPPLRLHCGIGYQPIPTTEEEGQATEGE